MKDEFSLPSGLKRQSKKSPRPSPLRTTAFRNCLGIIWSVSTLERSSGATSPVKFVNGFISVILRACEFILVLGPVPDVDEMPRHRRRRRHLGSDQMRPAAFALAPFKVAIRGARASFARLQNFGVHAQAHAAS